MDDTAVGWIAAIIIGGIAGWLAEMFMKSNQGVLIEHRSWHRRRGGRKFFAWAVRHRARRMGGLSDRRILGACILIAVARAFSRRAA
jgi:uncharacterized membrane protein YeaQ/YmgE (transglycosylase-associated protein family)